MRQAATALIADSDEATRRLCGSVLEQQGYRVLLAKHMAELMLQLRDHQPDIVLVDGCLSGSPRVGTLHQLQLVLGHPPVPVVVLGELDDAAQIIDTLDAGTHEYVSKPIRPQELLARMQGLSKRIASSRELQVKRDQLGEHSRVLMLLLEYSSTLATAEQLDNIIRDTLEVSASVFACQRAGIMLPDPDRRVLTLAGSLGLDERSVADLAVPIGEGVAGRVFASGGHVSVSSAGDGPGSGVHDCALYAKPPALAVAMRASSHIVGVLFLAERIGHGPFNELELDYVSLICNSSAVAIHNVHTRKSREDAQDALTVALASLAEHRDNETGQHLDRMTGFCMILAERLQTSSPYSTYITGDFIDSLRRAAPLHDIGKVGIPDRVLQKPQKLDAEELEIMRMHAVIGAETIRSARARSPHSMFLKMAEEITQNHHEWYDGGGYPYGARGSEIPLSARIAALADVYDALISRRVYKKAMSHEQASELIIELSGRQFDPVIVNAFEECSEDFRKLAQELSEELTVSDLERTVAAAAEAVGSKP